jgi:hypothetical protein
MAFIRDPRGRCVPSSIGRTPSVSSRHPAIVVFARPVSQRLFGYCANDGARQSKPAHAVKLAACLRRGASRFRYHDAISMGCPADALSG